MITSVSRTRTKSIRQLAGHSVSFESAPATIRINNIPVSMIDDNPFNPRIHYNKEEELRLAMSMSSSGLLSPIRVRTHDRRYQVVFGHRRLHAARLLGWKTIAAVVGDYSDEQMALLALVENIERNRLSDYERAIAFNRLNKEFGLTYEQVGKLVGCSKTHISNYIRMLELFDDKTLKSDPTLRTLLLELSEHHARILARIRTYTDRAIALRLAVKERLSVRELERIVSKFRSWFGKDIFPHEGMYQITPNVEHTKRRSDLTEIFSVLLIDFESPHTRDFDSFCHIHSFESGFSIYSIFPPQRMVRDREAFEKERDWFYSVAPQYRPKIRDIEVKFHGQVAVASLYVDYYKEDGKDIMMSSCGTVVLVKRSGKWVIVHEHWSKEESRSSPGQTSFRNA